VLTLLGDIVFSTDAGAGAGKSGLDCGGRPAVGKWIASNESLSHIEIDGNGASRSRRVVVGVSCALNFPPQGGSWKALMGAKTRKWSCAGDAS